MTAPSIFTVKPDGSIVVEGASSSLVGIPSTFLFSPGVVSLSAPQIVPLTTAPSQQLTVTLGSQICTIRVFTKSINVPISPPGTIVTDPPVYENANPVFVDLYVNDAAIVLGVLALDRTRLAINGYLGFVGDLAFIDTQGTSDPYGVPRRLPPLNLRNADQLASFSNEETAPDDVAGICPGLGSRFLLTYWPDLR